ncbi:molybdopterin cofactor-binding domain-containing protein [Tistrella bauzanensis]
MGDAEAALLDAATVVEGRFETPTQHHNPMELFGTVAEWTEGRLIIHEGCQNTEAVKAALAQAFDLPPDRVAVKSGSVGGGFGQKSPPKLQTALVAYAARMTGRPVKLVTPRGQIFHIAPYRPRSVHHIRLGADAAGRMTAISYDVVQENIPGARSARRAITKTSRACMPSGISGPPRAIFISIVRRHAIPGARTRFRPASRWKARSTTWPMRSARIPCRYASITPPPPTSSPASRSRRISSASV